MYEKFYNKYKLSKTMRFGLIPQGETLKFIEERGILEEDRVRAEEKVKAQEIADRYHREYIDRALRDYTLPEEYRSYASVYLNPDKYENPVEALKDYEPILIEDISRALTSPEGYKDMFKADMWKKTLPAFCMGNEEELKTLSLFDGFTTYFTGYNRQREYMYDASGKRGTIANRLISENLPRFLDNSKKMAHIAEVLASILDTAAKELAVVIGCNEKSADRKSLTDAFDAGGYNFVLTQEGLDRYNQLIGGYSLEDGTKIRGINEYVSMYNQSEKDKSKRLPFLLKLRKQILSEKTTLSFVADKFTEDSEVLDAVFAFDKAFEPEEVVLADVIRELDSYDTDRVYIKADMLRTISDKVFDSWSYIDRVLSEKYDRDQDAPEKKRKTKKYEEDKKRYFKNMKEYSVKGLDDLSGIDGKVGKYLMGAAGFHALTIDDARKSLNKDVKLSDDRSLKRDNRSKAAIRGYLEAVVDFRRFVSMFMTGSPEKDDMFYSKIEESYEVLAEVKGLYDKTRNYLSGKLYTNEKIKLNFGNAVLLDGWSESVEATKMGTILLRDGKYYLGIIAKGQGDLFAKVPDAETEDTYQKMRYNLISGANKSLPHVVFSRKGIETFKPSAEIMKIYKNGTFKKGKDFSLSDCHKLIDFYKECVAKNTAWECFDFRFSETSSYEDISGFFHEVEEGGYSLKFRDIDKDVIDKMVADGQLYLFEIWHKDFSEHAHGKPDLATIYWRAVFDPRNENSLVYKLNGGAEIFFRKASIKESDIIRHKAGDVVKAKNPNTEKQTRVLEYDIIKDRRFTVDKFQLNVPITLNASAPDFAMMNTEAKLAIKNSDAPHIVGVSRGENSLIHITVLDLAGNVVESKNLNVIGNTDYAELLARREAERTAERKNWETVEGIKNLKEGYISCVVREIADLMIKHNAVLAIEDLNTNFKQARQKIEKAVYQQLEGKLINKLSYLVNKDAAEGEAGEAFKAYQLTSPFESFEKIGRQTGFIFYVSPWNTSAIDPTTGFINLFDTRYTSVAAAQKFWHSFDNIVYDENTKCYRFDFNYNFFVNEDGLKMLEGTKTAWSVYSHGKRSFFERDDKGLRRREIDLNEAITGLLEEQHLLEEDDLKSAICIVSDKSFHESLLKIFGLMVNLRNDGEIISPVKNDKSEFFRGSIDANASLNIARKGLMLAERIREASDEELLGKGKEGISLAIAGNEWLKYVQERR